MNALRKESYPPPPKDPRFYVLFMSNNKNRVWGLGFRVWGEGFRVRSCNWYCRKELVLEVERVNEPVNYVWLKDGQSVQSKKSVFGSEGWVSAPLLV